MRDAWPQSAQERRARRNRDLARRGKTLVALGDVLQIALAIVLDTAALVVWNVGTRPFARLIADLRAGLADRTIFFYGVRHLLAGALLLGLGVASAFTLVHRPGDFSIVEIWAIIAALLIEQIVGDDLRAKLPRF